MSPTPPNPGKCVARIRKTIAVQLSYRSIKIDIQTLTQQLLTFLAPFLPYLLKMGEQAAGEAAKKLGAEAWERAQALWAKLKPKAQAKPAAQEAAQDLAAHPADEDARAALRLQLRKILAEDETLALQPSGAPEALNDVIILWLAFLNLDSSRYNYREDTREIRANL